MRCRRFKENDKNAKRSLGECERTPEDTLRGPSRARRAAPGRRPGKPTAPKGCAEGQLALSARPQDTGASYAANRNLSSRQGLTVQESEQLSRRMKHLFKMVSFQSPKDFQYRRDDSLTRVLQSEYQRVICLEQRFPICE